MIHPAGAELDKPREVPSGAVTWTPSHEDGKTAGRQTQGVTTATVNQTPPHENTKTANPQTQGAGVTTANWVPSHENPIPAGQEKPAKQETKANQVARPTTSVVVNPEWKPAPIAQCTSR